MYDLFAREATRRRPAVASIEERVRSWRALGTISAHRGRGKDAPPAVRPAASAAVRRPRRSASRHG